MHRYICNAKFFEGKATEVLLSKGVEAKHLNDDRLGRVLEQLWRKDLSQLFMKVSLKAVQQYGVELESAHLDSTSFAVEGEYADSTRKSMDSSSGNHTTEEASSIQIRRGYSRDHRPDLKQFMMNLICSGDGGIPLFLSMADGNQVDAQVFGPLMQSFSQQWQFEGIHVADAALYTYGNLRAMEALQWVSRVPLTIGDADVLLDKIDQSSFNESTIPGYAVSMVGNCYAEIKQHWLIVRSFARQKKDLLALDKKLLTAQSSAIKALKTLQAKSFKCPRIAEAAAVSLNEKLRYHQLVDISIMDILHYGKGGRPAKGTQPTHITYQVSAAIEAKTHVIERHRRRAGCFILATPAYDEDEAKRTNLEADEILGYYKGQSNAEKGFRFLKDPMFFAGSVFLKNPIRIEALGLIMGLCLLVYSLGERNLRHRLKNTNHTVPNQLGKPTAQPTLRWIFQCFQAIHVLVLNGITQVVNLTAQRLWILNFFPQKSRDYYLTG